MPSSIPFISLFGQLRTSKLGIFPFSFISSSLVFLKVRKVVVFERYLIGKNKRLGLEIRSIGAIALKRRQGMTPRIDIRRCPLSVRANAHLHTAV